MPLGKEELSSLVLMARLPAQLAQKLRILDQLETEYARRLGHFLLSSDEVPSDEPAKGDLERIRQYAGVVQEG